MRTIDKPYEATTTRVRWRDPATWGGILALGGGLFHTVVAGFMRQEVWARIFDEGFFNTVTLDPTPDRLPMAEAFWLSPGSFGVPLLLLGGLVLRHTRRGERVPAWLGSGVVAWAVLLGLLGGFDAGTIALLLVGGLFLAGARFGKNRRGRGRGIMSE
ncbi:DUF6463 family protein [Amycolatopsis sp. EV170708-02-1]|uniref:DUF6463 family protein n=1 Tax=Amycolatopsis sp. EV170708-02-1 TaxID=2919322 RepID=UPI001F0C6461|nr:DUF6463 family protein [Amycolatopsis sp. EV170708-02-1]UMP05909.1 DUF6463 family protein [Amycolatopsis sp. EV170708-02-1]